MRYIVILFFTLLLMSNKCSKENTVEEVNIAELELQIKVRWSKAYELQNKNKINSAIFWWGFFLGADLPLDAKDRIIQWEEETVILLDIGEMGFSKKALKAFDHILEVLRKSEEYQKMGSIDLGRLVVLTLNSSWHYYEITAMPKQLLDFTSQYHFSEETVILPKGSSCISSKDRYFKFLDGDKATLAFISAEGDERTRENFADAEEFEVYDLMDNGQFRFAVYDYKGKLKAFADNKFTRAGKPSKCLWCHETSMQSLFCAPLELKENLGAGFLSLKKFDSLKVIKGEQLEAIRTVRDIQSDFDFKRKELHYLLELVYISFLEPSAERLALEWNMPLADVRFLVKDLPHHEHEEFAYLGDTLYERKDVDLLSPYGVIRVVEDAREVNDYEPNFFE